MGVRDHALEVTGGTAAAAGRVDGRNDLWWVRVQPDSDAGVTVVLPPPRTANAVGAICTADGKRLSNRLELTVPGPQPTLSTDATLSGLTLSGVGLSAFDPAIAEYTRYMAHYPPETTVAPMVNDDGATYVIKLDGVVDADGTVSLAVGVNVITVEVTAEDGQNRQTYTIRLIRSAPGLVMLSEMPGPVSAEWTGPYYVTADVPDDEKISITTNTNFIAHVLPEEDVHCPIYFKVEHGNLELAPVVDGMVPDRNGNVFYRNGELVTENHDLSYRGLPYSRASTEGFYLRNCATEPGVGVVAVSTMRDGDSINYFRIPITTQSRFVVTTGPPPSTDATLSGLALSDVNIGTFDSATTEYTASVANDVTETTVTATANDDGATYVIKLGGVENADGTVALAEGDNAVTIEVTAEDGQTTKTYTVAVTRGEAPPQLTAQFEDPPESHNGTDPFTFRIAFSEPISTSYVGVRDHALKVTGGTAAAAGRVDGRNDLWWVRVQPDSDAGVTVVLPTTEDCDAVGAICTADGKRLSNRLELTVPGPQPTLSTDATLSGLELSGVNIGTFDSATTAYAASVANSVTETRVTPTTNDDGATNAVKLDGVADSDGTVSLSEGGNVITIEVTAEDGQTMKTYTVTVTRAEAPPPASTDATLSGLTLSGVNIGTFASATTEYTADVGYDVTESTVTATANDGGATYVVKLDGAEDADGTVDLAVGANAITIEVTAEDERTTKTYTVTVTRAEAPPSDDATLSGLTLSGVNFGTFASATTEYTASVENDVTETTVSATANDGGATYVIKLDGTEDADGTVSLAVGANAITVEVTAEDGNTVKTYTVTVTRAAPPSDDATLSSLELSSVNIGTFNSATTEYTASVENEVTETTVMATANDDGATYVIKLDGSEDGDGVITLAEGSNAITIEVTAEDGNTVKTYTVTVTRAAPTAPSASVTVTLSPRPEQYSTGTDITIEWTDADACGDEYFVGVYDNEELEVVVRVLGYHPAPETTKLSADLGLPWDRISSYDWWVGVTCTAQWTLVGKASLQSGLPSDYENE